MVAAAAPTAAMAAVAFLPRPLRHLHLSTLRHGCTKPYPALLFRLATPPPLHPFLSSCSAAGDGDAASPTVPSNSDLSPTPQSGRTMTAADIASLWIGLVVGVPAYYLAGSLVSLGMSAVQAVSVVSLSNLILLFPLIAAAAPAVSLGLPFPVLARAPFGVVGSLLPSLLRALVGCGWFGIESWIGGRAIFLLLPSSFTAAAGGVGGPSVVEFGCFIAFWAAQLGIIAFGMDGISKLEKFSAPILVALTGALLLWAYLAAGGFGPMLSLPPRLAGATFWSLFFPSVNANISYWATIAVNIPDFARFARSQADQALGQAGLPLFMGLFSLAGVAITSATELIFGELISDPIDLLRRVGAARPVVKLLAIFGISLATITTNIAANVVAPANALVGAAPRFFTFTRGAVATALVGLALQPWRLLSSSESFVYTWLLGYSALMGPISGIMLADYYLVRRCQLEVAALYDDGPSGAYYYWRGVNPAAIAALVAGVLPIVPGFLQNIGVVANMPPAFLTVYNNAWFVSFFIAGIVHCLLCPRNAGKKTMTTETS